MKKQTLVTIGLLIAAVFLLGVFYGKTRTRTTPPQGTTAPDYLYLTDYDVILKNDSDFYPHPSPIPKEQVSPELKEFLISKQYPTYTDTNSCIPDNGICTTDNTDLQVEEVNLGGDSTKEYIILPWKVCECPLRGASGNGDIVIVKRTNETFEVIGTFSGNGFAVSKNKTNGWNDIVTNYHSSAGSGTQTIYKFQAFYGDTAKGSYEKYLSKVYNFSRVKK